MGKPLCIDLFCGLGGWAEGFLAEGWNVIGFDIERHDYGSGGYPGWLVLQDVLTLYGSQFKDADCIVASPPCQAYSYRAMPWKRAKALPPPSNELFDTCFRIQREACAAGGRYIPMVVENVLGAIPWVGPAKWHYGSYYLWGDVPALMPTTFKVMKGGQTNWRDNKKPGYKGQQLQDHFLDSLKTTGHINQRDGYSHTRHLISQRERDAVKEGGDWWNKECRKTGMARLGSKSPARKAASALIAKIPFALSHHIARVYKP